MSERSELIIKHSAFLCLIRARSEARTWMSSQQAHWAVVSRTVRPLS
jgi:hypothetical protein